MNDPARAKAKIERLASVAPELAQTFASLTTDIALILDDDGIIRFVRA